MKSTRRPTDANRTGMDASDHADGMRSLTAIAEPSDLAREDLATLRQRAIKDAPATGSPPPAPDAARQVVLDLLSARLAYERAGTRLYDAVIAKATAGQRFAGGPTSADLTLIRTQEAEHRALLQEAILELAGDPTLVSPGASLEMVASLGLLQAVQDARTDLGECLTPLLIAELADRAAWASLIETVDAAGFDELADRLRDAVEHEEEHLMKVQGWLRAYRVWRLEGNGRRPSASRGPAVRQVTTKATAVVRGQKRKAVVRRKR